MFLNELRSGIRTVLLPVHLETNPLQKIIYSNLSFTLFMKYLVSKLISSVTHSFLPPAVSSLLQTYLLLVWLIGSSIIPSLEEHTLKWTGKFSIWSSAFERNQIRALPLSSPGVCLQNHSRRKKGAGGSSRAPVSFVCTHGSMEGGKNIRGWPV